MLTTNTPCRLGRARRGSQRGVSLLVAMIVLLVMTLAGIGLMRSISTSGVIAGNVALQQAATHSADVGVETAIAFLQSATSAALQSSVTAGPGIRYVAHREDPNATTSQSWDSYWTTTMPARWINVLTKDASGNTVSVPQDSVAPSAVTVDAAGNAVSFVIHRLCNSDGVEFSATVPCSATPSTAGTPEGSSRSLGLQVTAQTPPYYRITVRVAGPRNTVSYVQVVVGA